MIIMSMIIVMALTFFCEFHRPGPRFREVERGSLEKIIDKTKKKEEEGYKQIKPEDPSVPIEKRRAELDKLLYKEWFS